MSGMPSALRPGRLRSLLRGLYGRVSGKTETTLQALLLEREAAIIEREGAVRQRERVIAQNWITIDRLQRELNRAYQPLDLPAALSNNKAARIIADREMEIRRLHAALDDFTARALSEDSRLDGRLEAARRHERLLRQPEDGPRQDGVAAPKSADPLVAESPGAVPPSAKLALITPWNELCGIAAYSRYLKSALDPDFDIDIFELDDFILRSDHPRLRMRGDRLIKEYARRLGGYDAVNLQLEFGTLGLTARDIYRRLSWLIRAAPALTVTFHTVVPSGSGQLGRVLSLLGRCRPRAALDVLRQSVRRPFFSDKVFALLRHEQDRKPVSAIVHTGRERRRLLEQEGIEHVFDHPLAFLNARQIEQTKAVGGRSHFPALAKLPQGHKVIGVFGFISGYKNFEFVIRALRSLPQEYHLAVFGAINPKSLAEGELIARDLKPLYDAGRFDADLNDLLLDAFLSGVDAAKDSTGDPPTEIEARDATPLLQNIEKLRSGRIPHPDNLASRVHFLGEMSDDKFSLGLTACDVTVFPYLEVGQTSSGPISQAVELGCRILAVRNHVFRQFADYHPGRVDFYDVGNIVEFVERLRALADQPPPVAAPTHTIESAAAVYRRAMAGFGG